MIQGSVNDALWRHATFGYFIHICTLINLCNQHQYVGLIVSHVRNMPQEFKCDVYIAIWSVKNVIFSLELAFERKRKNNADFGWSFCFFSLSMQCLTSIEPVSSFNQYEISLKNCWDWSENSNIKIGRNICNWMQGQVFR